MVKKVYIIRHCDADGQSPDASLTHQGVIQAEELADFLTDIRTSYIVSSPFKRAVQSIEPFARKRGIEVMLDGRLSERVLSSIPQPDWLDKLEATFHDMNVKYEGGESSHEAMKRIVSVVDDFVASDKDNGVIVTHGGIMALLLHYYDSGFGFEQWQCLSNPDVFLLKISTDDCYVKRLWANS